MPRMQKAKEEFGRIRIVLWRHRRQKTGTKQTKMIGQRVGQDDTVMKIAMIHDGGKGRSTRSWSRLRENLSSLDSETKIS